MSHWTSCDPSLIRSGWFNSLAGVVKRRFASYVKLHLANGGSNGGGTTAPIDGGGSNNRFDKHHQRSVSASGVPTTAAPPQQYCSQLPVSKMAPPSPHVLSGIDRRHRSPDPPPRFATISNV